MIFSIIYFFIPRSKRFYFSLGTAILFLGLLITSWVQAGELPLSSKRESAFWFFSALVFLLWLGVVFWKKPGVSQLVAGSLGAYLFLNFFRALLVLYQVDKWFLKGLGAIVISIFALILFFLIGRALDKAEQGKIRTGLAFFLLVLGVSIISFPSLSWLKYFMSKKQKGAVQPNIIFIVMDTVRRDHLSVYGYHRQTSPFLRELAKSGWVFEQAYSTSPWTLPSHASFFTGLLPSQHNCNYEHFRLDKTYKTLAEKLKELGYFTIGWSNNPLLNYPSGLLQGFDRFVENNPMGIYLGEKVFKFWLKLHLNLAQDSGAEYTNLKLRRWLARLSQNKKPFFLFVNYMEAHLPYPKDFSAYKFFQNPAQAQKKYPQPDWDRFNCSGENREAVQKTVIKWYDGAIYYLDQRLRELYQNLVDLNLIDNTVLVILSDHGESFGEHNWWGHGATLYNSELAVPLLISFPKLLKPASIKNTFSLAYLPDLILALAQGKTSSSIFSFARSKKYAYAEIFEPVVYLQRMKRICPTYNLNWLERRAGALISYPYKLIIDSKQNLMCFDLSSDFQEIKNLAPAQSEICLKLFEQLKAHSKFLSSPRSKVRINSEQAHALRALQYLR